MNISPVEDLKPGDIIKIKLTIDDTTLWHRIASVVRDEGTLKASFVSGCREKVVTLRSPFYQVQK